MVILTGFGCAAKKLAIDNADTLITYQIGKDLPLNSAQKDKLQKQVKTFLKDLRPMAYQMEDVLKKFDPKKLETVEPTYQDLEKQYLFITKNFSQLLAQSMAMLDKDQQKKYLEIQADKTLKLKKNKPSDRVSRHKKRLEQFLGKINNQQQEFLLSYNDYSEKRFHKRIERREKLQEIFKEIFKRSSDQSVKEQLFQEAFVNYQKESLEGNKNLEMLNSLIPTLNEDQIKHLNGKKEEIIDLLKYFRNKEY